MSTTKITKLQQRVSEAKSNVVAAARELGGRAEPADDVKSNRLHIHPAAMMWAERMKLTRDGGLDRDGALAAMASIPVVDIALRRFAERLADSLTPSLAVGFARLAADANRSREFAATVVAADIYSDATSDLRVAEDRYYRAIGETTGPASWISGVDPEIEIAKKFFALVYPDQFQLDQARNLNYIGDRGDAEAMSRLPLGEQIECVDGWWQVRQPLAKYADLRAAAVTAATARNAK